MGFILWPVDIFIVEVDGSWPDSKSFCMCFYSMYDGI